MTVRIIGDEIHFDGQLVAIMTDNAAPTHRERFTDALGIEADHSLLLAALEKKATESARGGLLRLTDLATIIGHLKEST